jgi:NitT/TauT family transport system ATP-binding protein
VNQPSHQSIVSVKDISLSYPRPPRQGGMLDVLGRTAFEMKAGEFVTLLGPTGCGKTSLLRIIAGLVKPTAGEVSVGGVPIDGPSPLAAYVFQQIALVPWRTVQGNVELALEMRHHRAMTNADHEKAREMLALVGLSGFEDYYPNQISGGMQQRVGIARALAVEPRLLLMDEPFGALDAQTKRILQDELLSWRARTGLSVLFVSHDLDEAVYLSDRVLVMSARPAHILEQIPVTLPEPRTAHDCRATPENAEAHRKAWSLLRSQNALGKGAAA